MALHLKFLSQGCIDGVALAQRLGSMNFHELGEESHLVHASSPLAANISCSRSVQAQTDHSQSHTC